MKIKLGTYGFTMVELLIVITVVAILVALAIPSYTGYVRKANRGEAQQLLLNWANNQEIWRANNASYADETTALGVPTQPAPAKYVFTVSGESAMTYILTATAQGDQAKDKEHGISCSVITLDQSNAKTDAECW